MFLLYNIISVHARAVLRMRRCNGICWVLSYHTINLIMQNVYFYKTTLCLYLTWNWWKGKPSGSIACTRKQQPRFYGSCSSVVINDATPLTPPSHWRVHERNSIFKCKQHTCTLHDPWGPEKYDYTMYILNCHILKYTQSKYLSILYIIGLEMSARRSIYSESDHC